MNQQNVYDTIVEIERPVKRHETSPLIYRKGDNGTNQPTLEEITNMSEEELTIQASEDESVWHLKEALVFG